MCYTKGQRKQKEMYVAFWPWTQPPRLTSLLLGSLVAPSEEEDRFFWMASQTWGPVSVLSRGTLMTSFLDLLQFLKTFGSNTEGKRLFFVFAFWVFAEMSLQLAFPSNMSGQLWLCELLWGLLPFFFLLNNLHCTTGSAKLALFCGNFAIVHLVTL